MATPGGAKVHSRPQYHAALVALFSLIPAIAILAVWAWFGEAVTRAYTIAQIPPETLAALDQAQLAATLQRIGALASGYGVAGAVQPFEQAAADTLRSFQFITFLAIVAAAAAVGILALLFAYRRIAPRLRARNEVEAVVRVLLILCSAIAILTTLGIVLSLVFEAGRFFTFINPLDFFFGTVWSPKFSSTAEGDYGLYGLLPLLTGTLWVALIASLVAVPIGLMTAIYLSQYAPRGVRAVVKPIIEILAAE